MRSLSLINRRFSSFVPEDQNVFNHGVPCYPDTRVPRITVSQEYNNTALAHNSAKRNTNSYMTREVLVVIVVVVVVVLVVGTT